jgi:hypothetical protein
VWRQLVSTQQLQQDNNNVEYLDPILRVGVLLIIGLAECEELLRSTLLQETHQVRLERLKVRGRHFGDGSTLCEQAKA